ncbi:MAG: guanylyl cyclase [Steroidobacteraceae bacterium]|nr:guanylyl cyclase [Steroidobacteraceae bacterium]
MAFTVQELQAGFHVGECLIEPRQNRILGHDVDVRIEPRVMDVLVSLAARAGEVVSRETLNQEVWRDVVVTDQAVTNCISELRHHLGDDRSTNRVIETIPKRGYRLTAPVRLSSEAPAAAAAAAAAAATSSSTAPASSTASAATRPRWGIPVALALLAAIVLAGVWWWQRTPKSGVTSVAVVRFENAAGDEKLDYLALALSDETATLLTQSRDLAVRPSNFVNGDDPLAVARDRHVDHVVTGRYYLEEDARLSLAIEAQHARQERVIWRTLITVPAGDLLAMRARIAEGVRNGLLPALGVTAGSSGVTPQNAEAYRLYLRSLELPQQPEQTLKAIELLERVVTLEPMFAPAWEALGVRYYASGTWFTGAEEARQKSLAAHRRAVDLDPDMLASARQIVTFRTEAGDLEGAYLEARQLLEHFGPRADTHFSMSYVYRYGGMLEDSQRHCELARKRDPQDPGLRSCGYAYLYDGKLEPVMDFFKLDEGSYFVHWAKVLYQLRRNDREAALQVVLQAADEPITRLMKPCLEGTSGAALDAPVEEFVRHWKRSDDPETAYAIAPILSFCGRHKEALEFLARGVDLNYCSFPALDQDPIWSALRGDPEFQRIRTKAMACHDKFRRMVQTHGKV